MSRPPGGRRCAALVLVLLAPLLVVLAPSASATTTLEARWASSVLSAMNTQRHYYGLPSLRSNSALTLSARRHNIEMARYNRMLHQLPDEATLGTRVTRAGYHWSYLGENIGVTSMMTEYGALAIEKAMYSERAPGYTGHRAAILSRTYVDVGVSIYFDYTHHMLWYTTDFGRPGTH